MDAARRTSVTPESVGERLRQLRSAAGISQDELARRSGLSTAAVGALERGTRRAPTRETIALLAEALSLSHSERAELELATERGRARTRTPMAEALATTHNLPSQLTSFVGGADQIEQITRRIESSRLVTVLGSGGFGKTRTALEVAMHLATNVGEEVRFVDLAPLRDGSFITGRIAGLLDVRLSDADDSPEALARALKTRRVLLVLDNCEHLIADAARTVRALLQGCPNVRILTTTRERLGIMGEVVHHLPPLALPDASRLTIGEARSASALELFLQRTHLADPDLTFTDQDVPILIDVCRRLQGIPLAIELVSAQVPTLGLKTLSRRLEATLGIARGARGIPDRQQTMRDTIAWSYDLLTEPERLLLRRLGVFAGGCTLAAAESVCADTDLQSTDIVGQLASLVDKSLVNAVIDGDHMRYVLLDSTRTFARERLGEAGEQATFSRRHAQWLAAYGESACRAYVDQPNLVWLNEFLAEIDNVRNALEWALRAEADDDFLLGGQIAGSFRGLWLIQGLFGECRRWTTLLLERIDETQQPIVAANLLTALAQALDGSARLAAYERLITVLQGGADRLRLARTLLHLVDTYCDNVLLVKAQDAVDDARQILDQEGSLEKPSYELKTLAAAIASANAHLSFVKGRFTEARKYFDEALVHCGLLSDDYLAIQLLVHRAELEFVAGDTALATEYSQEAVKRADATPRAPLLAVRALSVAAGIRLSTRYSSSGEAAARRAYSLVPYLQKSFFRLISLQNLAAIAILRGHQAAGARLLGFIEAWCETAQYHRSPFEQATYELLANLLRTKLGTDTDTHMAEGRHLDVERATEEVLLLDFPSSAEMSI